MIELLQFIVILLGWLTLVAIAGWVLTSILFNYFEKRNRKKLKNL